MLSTLLAAGLSACADQPPVFLNAAACSTLVPKSWANGVPLPPLPATKAAGDWISFSDAVAGTLDIANSRTADALSIIQTCEARDAAVQKSLTPAPWYEFWK